MDIRVGHGYDVHRFAEGRELYLCGVLIPDHVGLLGHSDADVALHALCDALLGAIALGDIGAHFPDTDPAWKGADSTLLLRAVCDMLAQRGWSISNADITVCAQAPRLRPYIERMRMATAQAMGIDTERVSIKATTTEGLGFTGRKEGIAAHAVALVMKA